MILMAVSRYSLEGLRYLVRRLKLEKGMNQKQVADLIGVSTVQLQAYLGTAGDRRADDLKGSQITALANALEMPVSDVMALLYPDESIAPISEGQREKLQSLVIQMREILESP